MKSLPFTRNWFWLSIIAIGIWLTTKELSVSQFIFRLLGAGILVSAVWWLAMCWHIVGTEIWYPTSRDDDEKPW